MRCKQGSREGSSNELVLTRLKRLLGLDENSHEVVEVGGVNVADGDDAQVWRGRGAKVEACAVAG